MQIIIFPTDNNRVAILSPATDMDINEVAEKDVPDGKPWRIIDADDLPPSDVWLWADEGPIVPYVVVSSDSVNAERDRRVLKGSTFTLTSGKSVVLCGDNTTKENLHALAFAATLRISQGAVNSITLFRDETDYVHELTQVEVLELWAKSAEFVSRTFQAAWFLKDGPSIPQDYTDDKYWSAE